MFIETHNRKAAIIRLETESSRVEKEQLFEQLLSGDCTPIHMLDFTYNTLTPEELDRVCTLVERAKQLVVLNLSYCELGIHHSAALERLSKVIKEHPTLLSILFSGNPLNQEGLVHLINSMLNNRILELDLAFCEALDHTLLPRLIHDLQDPLCKMIAFNSTATPLQTTKQANCNIQRALINLTLADHQRRLVGNTHDLHRFNIPDVVAQYLEDQCVQKHLVWHSPEAVLGLYPLLALKKCQERSPAVSSDESAAPVIFAMPAPRPHKAAPAGKPEKNKSGNPV
jgi:hypothetical protein